MNIVDSYSLMRSRISRESHQSSQARISRRLVDGFRRAVSPCTVESVPLPGACADLRLPHIVQSSPRFLPLLGGPEIDISTIVSWLKEYRYSVLSNALRDVPTRETLSDNCEVWRVPPEDPFLSSGHEQEPWKWRLLKAAVAELFRNREKTRLLGGLRPDLIHVRDIDGWNLLRMDNLLRTKFFQIWARQLASFARFGTKLLLTKHFQFNPRVTPGNFLAFEAFLLEQFEFVQCVDRHIFVRVQETQPQAKVWFTPVYVDTELFSPQPWCENEGLVIGYAGRHDTDKGTDMILELIRSAPPGIEFEIALSGNTQEIQDFGSRLPKSSERKVSIRANVPHEELPRFFGRIDLLVNPVAVEGISRVTLEAMACGRPVVMTGKGNRHPVIHAQTGYLVESGASAFLELISQLPNAREELRKLGFRARSIVETEYGVQLAMERQREVYETVLSSESN